jgi:hypothetical protein
MADPKYSFEFGLTEPLAQDQIDAVKQKLHEALKTHFHSTKVPPGPTSRSTSGGPDKPEVKLNKIG